MYISKSFFRGLLGCKNLSYFTCHTIKLHNNTRGQQTNKTQLLRAIDYHHNIIDFGPKPNRKREICHVNLPLKAIFWAAKSNNHESWQNVELQPITPRSSKSKLDWEVKTVSSYWPFDLRIGGWTYDRPRFWWVRQCLPPSAAAAYSRGKKDTSPYNINPR